MPKVKSSLTVKTNRAAAAEVLRAFERELASLAAELQRANPDAQIVVELREDDQAAGDATTGGKDKIHAPAARGKS